ncbi:rho guanine nucleotide exchange factor 40-like isoform X1 [Bufo gargarizans]|uniref:rho guanine nucleotide exchange factor 40-like isoform X1 n=1 Tax=Bufo gargarizans TaxID=30331 RepID=UPI001CF41776|nr:rho guanine nucleotide exchange factor 40-like isoform X1 [Bufo gargarizans]
MTPQSVEDCLQSTLSSLYPPFEVTAPTLLTQVFSVLEKTYREDSLRYTLEFLIPAKRILQTVQHQACSQYSGFLFFHEGWPLCLGEKILIQLSSLPWHFLKPGDFYLQVVPYLECSPRLVLKCLSQDGSGVQEIVVPESSHSFLFSAEWLNSINKDRSSVRLENCLAAVEEKVLRLPWSEVIYPRFIHKDGFIVGRKCPPGPLMPPLEFRSPGDGGITIGEVLDPKVNSHLPLLDIQEDIHSWRVGAASPPMLDSLSGSAADCVEGEYVELSPPNTGIVSKDDSPRDTWLSRAKTAPSRKGKKKAPEAWLHQRKPGKVGSLSTLKGRSEEVWESRSRTEDSGEQTKSSTEVKSYWDVDTSNYSAESDVLAQWRKGLDLLQRHERDLFSGRQLWESPEIQVRNAKDCNVEQREISWQAKGTAKKSSSHEFDNLSNSLKGFSLNVDMNKETENVLSTCDITTDCQNIFSEASIEPSKEEKCNDHIDECQNDCQLDNLKQALKESQQPMDGKNEICPLRGSSVTRTGRTWADGQEVSAFEGDAVEDMQVLSVEAKEHHEKVKHPAWQQISELSQKTGKGRRKKRNKRGRGPMRTEARKGAPNVEQTKSSGKEEENNPHITSQDEVDIGRISQETNEQRLTAELVENVSACGIEPEQPPSSPKTELDASLPQKPLLQSSPIVDFNHLHREVNWDILESGVICLPGAQDREKSALLIVSPSKAVAEYTQKNIQEAILYLFSLLRSDLRDLGMTLIVDLRDSSSNSETFLQVLHETKDSFHACIKSTLIVCDAENPAAGRSDLFNAQVVETSDLRKYVEAEELPESLGGEGPYVHNECVRSQRSLWQLHSLCCDVLDSLGKVTQEVEDDVTEDFQWLISHHRDAMKKTLTDDKLQRLQRDGGTLVARLHKSPYLRLYDPVTFDLYEKVDEALHHLVQLSNQKLQELEAKLPPPECRNSPEDSHSLLDAQGQGLDIRGETRDIQILEASVIGTDNRRLEVGVRIRGLEVSSRELADRTCSPPRGHVLSRGDGRGPDAPWGGVPRPEGKRSPQRLLLDLLCSERSYVQSLRRSLEVRGSCPAGLALRGSLEQLLNFHTHFLRDLQNCVSHPLTVSYCFLQHAEQLRLYSLYVKNKQKVELFLPSPSGSLKGKKRDQKEEEESWGILQRPLEQLDQYQRFLGDMMLECDHDTEQERQSLHAARELVGSLVLHGKNLLAAEAIRGFEMDEKEHGRLLLKDVFTVLSGRKKSLRHVFLFQKLLLLSKLKTAEGGLETYGFKQAFKTADMGLTENATEGDTRIELWFRRQKSRETLLLQAETTNVKETWNNEITKLLWDQGGLSKEHRVQDTSTIGSSHRSFLDIKAGFNAISERTVSALLTARGSRTRASVPFSSCEHSSPPSSLSLALTSGPSPRRLRSPGGVSLPEKISEEIGEAFTGGPVCLKSISPIMEGEKPKDSSIELIFPSTSV